MIEIDHVSKKFRIWEDRSRDLKETTINFLKGKKRSFRDLWALRDIHLLIREGETVAFIGENGSGKSTLLKLLSGIYAPDEGGIVIQGKTSSLLELGVGFHPDLTGEENVYLNGAMLGFNRVEMQEKFDAIVSFSEIGDFIYSPIRTYSSGMLMRLGFSIATSVDPDVLLVDEILAVGDEAFQEKCLNRMEKFKEEQKTIILVSHSMETVEQYCERAVLLQEGRVAADGPPDKTIDCYHALLASRTERRIHQELNGRPGKATLARADGPQPPVQEEMSQDGAGERHSTPASLSSSGQGQEPTERENLDQERFRLIEVQDPSFFAGKLFFETFETRPPQYPTHYIGVYADSGNPSSFAVIGYVHVWETEKAGLNGVGFVGGLCVESRWRSKGIEEKLLLSIENQMKGKKAFFIYTGFPAVPAQCGYEVLPHPHLMVKWVQRLPTEEKAKLVGAVMAAGPF